MKPLRLSLWLLLAVALPALAAPQFPELTGRVVDNADLLNPAQEQALDTRLAEAEATTSNQLVVLTVPDLQGYDIADYGYQLGRAWGIGQKGRDNGVVLIVAPAERQVRIEVGYGLEGALTDALSSVIIQNDIRPAFRAGDYATGIERGVNSILAAIAGEYKATAKPQKSTSGKAAFVYLIVLVVVTFLLIGLGGGGGGRGGRRSGLMFLPLGMGGFGGGGGGGFGGGGFGGGGGGFGGGGASGGW
ncbi:TPM domain-containing protein [Alloalcanivorax mobilis]|uniref:TPM domain-containing protein n=1 Tax=Alloalcanivorax mobilis TaxID=2019569 RepID=UPI000B5B28E9|nr:TPM domain-containing protein [Alloalcanivorax mobilis]ASK33183.1 methanol dehydrogenase [Alcanivorax sp. N3-2A]ASK37001.1 methanol dehydrogenase [Alcanivorax sp. N3-2A]|tara:strand:- start:1802 stop:2539 length:738 start_codon:yes stop_codon:yes gene_type:complete